jgi:hypothetical protein
MRQPKEQEIQKTITDFLKIKRFIVFKHRNVGIYKKDTGKYIPLAYGEKGISDIIACSPTGRFWAVEVKAPGKKPTEEQLDFLARVNAAGGKGILAFSLDEVMAAVGEEDSNNRPQAPQSSIPLIKVSRPPITEGSTTSDEV